jgi:hypothetical protein
MKEVYRLFAGIAASSLSLICSIPSSAQSSNVVAANEIIQKAVDVAKAAESAPKPEYSLVQKTVTEERDGKGQVKDRDEKAEQVRLRSGELVKDGEKKTSKKPCGKLDLKNSSRSDFINLLTPETIGKYIFSLISKTNLNGRAAFELAFKPRSANLPGKELTDKIMNQATGRIWIDAEEFELVKAHIQIDKEVPVAGFLGALKRAAFSLERVRLETGLWFEKFYRTDYEARRLMDSKRVITQSEFTNFRRINRG